MRLMYENLDTAVDEVEFFRSLRKHRDYSNQTFRKLPLGYEIECAVEVDGKVVGFCEFKRRHNKRHRYPTLILSLRKYKQLISYSYFESPAKLYVRWDDFDAVHVVRPQKITYDIEWGGRTDRGDWQDREPVVHIPGEHFDVLPLGRERLDDAGRDRLERLLKADKSWTVGNDNDSSK